MVHPELDAALHRAVAYQRLIQHADGYWVAELGCDTSVSAEAMYLRHLLSRVDEGKQERAATWLRGDQNADGGWPIFQGGPSQVDTTLKCYLALKLAGDDPGTPHMVAAREAVARLGGVEACHLFTQIYLAWGGLYPWDRIPFIPVEVLTLPGWLFSRYDLSYWARTIMVPLFVTLAYRPVFPVAVDLSEVEPGVSRPHPARAKLPAWRRLVLSLVEGLVEVYGRHPFGPWRRHALRDAESWMLERFERSDGLGAIWPAMVNAAVALKCLGYKEDWVAYREALARIDALDVEDERGSRTQPCWSPVWDTVWAVKGLAAAGVPAGDPALGQAANWLIAKQELTPGDWRHWTRKDLAPGGWYFQFDNAFYPDVDDTAVAVMALLRTEVGGTPGAKDRIRLAMDWIKGMQNPDGGWGAFDRLPRPKHWLNQISWALPFDGALLDPSTADVSARCLEALGRTGDAQSAEAKRAIAYLRKEQEPDGSWYGRWGVNYVYGTWSVLCAFAACGITAGDPAVDRAVAYLEQTQLPDGGWGETCWTYHDPASRGSGPTTASQTAWGLMGLIAAGRADSEAARRAVAYLLANQAENGTWPETAYTGNGFPRVFYLHYGMYAHYFPLLALGRYRQATSASAGEGSDERRAVATA